MSLSWSVAEAQSPLRLGCRPPSRSRCEDGWRLEREEGFIKHAAVAGAAGGLSEAARVVTSLPPPACTLELRIPFEEFVDLVLLRVVVGMIVSLELRDGGNSPGSCDLCGRTGVYVSRNG